MIKILSAYYDKTFKPYKFMAHCMKQSAENAGYEVDLRTLTENPNVEEDPTSGYYKVKFSDKLHGFRLAMDDTDKDLAWVDSDCLVLRNFDEVLTGCDVAIPIRRPVKGGTMFDRYSNTGVFFAKNNGYVREFLARWMYYLTPECRDDQEAMNVMLSHYCNLNSFPKKVIVEGAIVHLVPCDIYNNFYFDGTSDNASIVHFKGAYDERLYKHWLKKVVPEVPSGV